MPAFLDSPIGIIVFLVAVLLLFGPQKLPEIANQLGRALRELKRATSEISSTVNLDNQYGSSHYDSSYTPPRYDSYGNTYESSSVPEEDVFQSQAPDTKVQAALESGEPRHGDFAASALADTEADYGVGSAPTPASADSAPVYGATTEAPQTVTPRPAASTVPREP